MRHEKACLDDLRYLKVQPVEPFQAVVVDASRVERLERLENVRDRLRNGLNGGQVGGKHRTIVFGPINNRPPDTILPHTTRGPAPKRA